jgi:hypothetical protein
MVIGIQVFDVIIKGFIFVVMDSSMKSMCESVELSFVGRISCVLPYSTCSPFFLN